MAKKSITVLDAAWQVIERLVKALQGVTKRYRTAIPPKTLLAIAIAIYLLMQVSISFPKISTTNPIRDDDAYGFNLKAAEIREGCFLQDCPALNDLRAQITKPTDDPEVAAYRNRIYHRLFVVYHPLHSFALAGMNAAGIDYEIGYDLITALGKILLPIVVIYWVYSMWGALPSALALVLLAPTLFGGSGLHIIKMHTLAIGFALFLWAEIYRKTARAGWELLVLIPIMGTIHPLGKLLGLASLVFYLVLSEWPLRRRTIWIGAIGLAMLAALFLLPEFVSRPELRFDPALFYPGAWDFWGDLTAGLGISLAEMGTWFAGFGGALVLIPVALVGLLAQPESEKRKTLLTTAMILTLVVSSLLYVVPWYGNISFSRVWAIAGVFLVSAFAAGAVALLRLGFASEARAKKAGRGRGNWQEAAKLLVLVVLVLSIAGYLWREGSDYAWIRSQLPARGPLINAEQFSVLEAADTEPGDATILYMDEYALYYYMLHGGLQYGTIFYTPLRFTDDLDDWLIQREGEIGFVVNFNPLAELPMSADGAVVLEQAELRVSKPATPVEANILLTSSENARIEITYGDSLEQSIVLSVAAGEQTWVALPAEATNGAMFTVQPVGDSPIEVKGLRFSEEQRTLWPWGDGISLEYESNAGVIGVNLDPDRLAAPLEFDLVVLDDLGWLVLAKVVQ